MSKPEEPSFDEKTKNFLKSATSIIQSMMRGNDLFSSTEVREEREEICNECEMKDQMRGMCLSCGCVLKYKIPFASSECPLSKWGMDTDTIEAEVLRRVRKNDINKKSKAEE